MTTLTSPDGYSRYEHYPLPIWGLLGSTFVLAIVGVSWILAYSVQMVPSSRVDFVVGVALAMSASLFLHESLHFLANMALGYNPVYEWPNKVYVPKKNLKLWESAVVLLAPQLLSILYAGLIVWELGPLLQMVIGWGLIFNLPGGASDVAWVIRRATWPRQTRVVVGDDLKEYVAFPGGIQSNRRNS